MNYDLVNGGFELVASIAAWRNVMELVKAKKISGVFWPQWCFFAVWGTWSLLYYASIGHWISFGANIVIVSANWTWTVLAIRYLRRPK